MASRSGHCDDALTFKSSASSEDVQPRQGSLGDTMAAIQSASAFFDGSTLVQSSSGNDDQRLEVKVLHRQKSHPTVDAASENRTPSRPVPVKGALRRQQPSHEEHFALWRDHDDSDTQYLKRLYELRTWDMWVRITEARKRQRVGASREEVCGGEPPVLAMEPHLGETPPVPTGVSLHDEMIFSCDLE